MSFQVKPRNGSLVKIIEPYRSVFEEYIRDRKVFIACLSFPRYAAYECTVGGKCVQEAARLNHQGVLPSVEVADVIEEFSVVSKFTIFPSDWLIGVISEKLTLIEVSSVLSVPVHDTKSNANSV